jgi:hypothetical protein
MVLIGVFFGWGNLFEWDFQNFWLAIGLPILLLFWLYSFVWGIRNPLLELQDDTIFIRRSPFWRPQKIKADDVKSIYYSNRWKTSNIVIEYSGGWGWPAKIPVASFWQDDRQARDMAESLNEKVQSLKTAVS